MAVRLKKAAAENGLSLTDPKLADYMDSIDPLSHLRSEFEVPKKSDLPKFERSFGDGDSSCIYLVGNSLGLQPKRARKLVTEQLDMWAKLGVYGHFEGPYPWYSIGEDAADKILPIVGATSRQEVAVMTGLTTNLHLLLVAFYKPTASRHKIVIEGGAFPSDRYAVASQIKFHGFDSKQSMVQLHPRPSEETLRTEDITAYLEEEGESVAVVLLSGVQFYTGQLFQMQTVTEAAHKHGCYAGFDLAHAVGNVPLELHDWGVDFACWCSYKYLNSGAGGIAGIFVHERHANNQKLHRFAGWWGNDPSTRFQLQEEFIPLPGAPSFQLSNPPVLQSVSLIASLDVYAMSSMAQLREKSLLLTGYLELLINIFFGAENGTSLDSDAPKAKRPALPSVEIITPSDPSQRGCQLSLRFSIPVDTVQAELGKRGVVTDIRKPNVMRVAPVPLYSTFRDVYDFVEILKDIVA